MPLGRLANDPIGEMTCDVVDDVLVGEVDTLAVRSGVPHSLLVYVLEEVAEEQLENPRCGQIFSDISGHVLKTGWNLTDLRLPGLPT